MNASEITLIQEKTDFEGRYFTNHSLHWIQSTVLLYGCQTKKKSKSHPEHFRVNIRANTMFPCIKISNLFITNRHLQKQKKSKR